MAAVKSEPSLPSVVVVFGDIEDECSVMFVHERIVARRDAHQRLVLFDDERRNIFDIFFCSVDDGRFETCI